MPKLRHTTTHATHAPAARRGSLLFGLVAAVLGLALVWMILQTLINTFDPMAREDRYYELERARQFADDMYGASVVAGWLLRVVPVVALGVLLAGGAVVVLLVAYRQLAAWQTIKADRMIALERARVQQFPEGLTTLAFHDSSKAAPMLAPPAWGDEASDREEEAAESAAPPFAALLTAGRIGPGQPLLLGYDLASGDGIWGSWRDLYSAGLGGKQGSGKTWTAASLIAQSLLSGARVVVCDPHAGDDESLVTRLSPLLSAMELVSDDPRGILEAARYAHDEFERRKAQAKAKQPHDRTPLVLVIDEWTSLLRGELGSELPPLLAALTTEGRKYDVNALLLAQRWEAAAAGGSDVRNTLTAHFVHRMRGDEARMMTGMRASALPADTLSLHPGQSYLFDTRGAIRKVVTPLMTANDLTRVAAMLGGQASAAPSAAPSVERPIGFRVAHSEGTPEVAASSASGSAKWSPEEARIVAALAAGKKPGELAEELSGAKGGRAYQAAAARIAAVIARLAAMGGNNQ